MRVNLTKRGNIPVQELYSLAFSLNKAGVRRVSQGSYAPIRADVVEEMRRKSLLQWLKEKNI